MIRAPIRKSRRGCRSRCCKDLHLLTRDGQLNADARRKLKQIRHLVGLLRPALDDAMARTADPLIVDCGAGKSYLGALLYELVLGPAGARRACSRSRPAPSCPRRPRSAPPGSARRGSRSRPARSPRAARAAGPASSPRSTRATPPPTTRSRSRSRSAADHVAVVPCCQAEVARQLENVAPRRSRDRRAVRASAASPRARLAPDQRRPRPRARGPRLQGHRHRARRLGALGEERADPRQARAPLRRGGAGTAARRARAVPDRAGDRPRARRARPRPARPGAGGGVGCAGVARRRATRAPIRASAGARPTPGSDRPRPRRAAGSLPSTSCRC